MHLFGISVKKNVAGFSISSSLSIPVHLPLFELGQDIPALTVSLGQQKKYHVC